MLFVKHSQFNNKSGKDANKLAPSSCSAKKEMNIADFTDIAVAVSVLLYIAIIFSVISIITVINIISVIIILIAGIIAISKLFKKKQPVLC